MAWTSDDCSRVADLCAEAVRLAHDLLPALTPDTSSLVGQIRCHFGLLDAPASGPAVGGLLTQAAGGYVLMAAEQLAGVGLLYAAGPPVRLFPTVTLLRGVAEASGRVFWLLDPWTDKDGTKTGADWPIDTRRILGRLELVLVETLHTRLRRHRAQRLLPPVTDTAAAEAALREAQDRIGRPDRTANVMGKPGSWVVYGERLPVTTDWVAAATEYGHGQRHRGTGLNLYPLYSGYAHASLDVLLARPSTVPLHQAVIATDDEARDLAGTALRTFVAAFDAVLSVHGRSDPRLAAWEEHVDALILDL